MIKIDHIAIWSKDIEKLKKFYQKYFYCKSNKKYINKQKKFESYFLEFSNGPRLELMQMPTIPENKNDSIQQYLGIIHFALNVNGKENVNSITEILRKDGYTIISEPRLTGDGYYESCILDPDGNRIEIIA